MKEENYEKAIDYFNKCYSEYENNIDFLYNLANCYYQTADYDNSLRLIDRLLLGDDSYEDAYNLKAACFVRQNKFEDALNCLNEYLETFEGSQALLTHKKEIETMANISRKGQIQINIK